MATIAPHSDRTIISDVCLGKDNSAVVTISAVSEKGYHRLIKLIAASISTSADDQRFKGVDYFVFEVKAKQQEVVVINDNWNRTHLIGVYWDGTEGGLQTTVCLDKQLRPIKGRFACTPHNIATNVDDYRYGLCVKIGETHYTNCQAALMRPLIGLGPKYRYVEGKILCEYLLNRKTAVDVKKAAQKGEARRDETRELRTTVKKLETQIRNMDSTAELLRKQNDRILSDHNKLVAERNSFRTGQKKAFDRLGEIEDVLRTANSSLIPLFSEKRRKGYQLRMIKEILDRVYVEDEEID